MLKKLGYFVTESSEHFAEYTPWFIKPGRDDLIARYKVPLDEYPKRCVEQLANWHQELESYKRGERIEVKPLPRICQHHHERHLDRRAKRGVRQRAQR